MRLLSVYVKSVACDDEPKHEDCSNIDDVHIQVNGKEYSKNTRGHNIVVVDPDTGIPYVNVEYFNSEMFVTVFRVCIYLQHSSLYVSDVARGGARGPGPSLAKCLAPSGEMFGPLWESVILKLPKITEVVILYYLALRKFRLVQWQIPANPNGFAILMSFNGSGL